MGIISINKLYLKKRVVRCPVCLAILATKGAIFFRHCNIQHPIAPNLIYEAEPEAPDIDENPEFIATKSKPLKPKPEPKTKKKPKPEEDFLPLDEEEPEEEPEEELEWKSGQ